MEMPMEEDGQIHHKPDRRAFVTYGLIKSVVGAVLFLAIAYLALRCFPQAPMMPILGGVFGLSLLSFLASLVLLPIQYKKESYVLKDERLVAYRGSILSSSEQELLVKNITHISLTLPYVEHKLYQTGSIHIQAAGGDDVEVHMRSIPQPEAMYNELLKLLERNGFSVSCKAQVEADKPDMRGVWLSTLGGAVGGLFVLFWLVGMVVAASKDKELAGKLVLGPEFVLLAAGIVLAGLCGMIFYHGRSKHRQYRLYDDAITSKTDFLGVHQTLIPMKNLSDSVLQQGVIGRALGIHNVSLSCQGSGHEIVFPHVANGERWKTSLDRLLKSMAEQQAERKAAARMAAAEAPGFQGHARAKNFEVERDETFATSFKMDKRYLFIPALLMFGAAVVLLFFGGALAFTYFPQRTQGAPPPPQAILGMALLGAGGIALLLSFLRGIGGIITYMANEFKIMPTGFEQDFQFIFKRKVVFNADKVTGLIVKQGIFDRMLGTCSVEFWSIGASDHLRFSHVRLGDDLLDKIKAKVGLYPKETYHSVLTEATLADTWKANIFYYALLLIVTPLLASFSPIALFAIGVLFVAPFVFTHIYYKFHHLELYDDSLWFRKGIFFRTSYYIRYQDIKYISSTRYPFTDTGALTFDVAGERVIKTDNGEHKISNRFRVHYVPEIVYHHLAVDLLLSQQIELEKMAIIQHSLDQYRPVERKVTTPHMMQKLLVRGLALVILDALLVGGAFFLLVKGGLTPEELTRLKELPAVAFGLAWGLPILIAVNVIAFALLVLQIRSISYILDDQKVSKRWGIFFKKHLGIHFADIDFIGKRQRALNKLFGTTDITVNTVGSSATDLLLDAMTDANAFYAELKQSYRPEDASETP